MKAGVYAAPSGESRQDTMGAVARITAAALNSQCGRRCCRIRPVADLVDILQAQLAFVLNQWQGNSADDGAVTRLAMSVFRAGRTLRTWRVLLMATRHSRVCLRAILSTGSAKWYDLLQTYGKIACGVAEGS
jgi:hypothetical protein